MSKQLQLQTLSKRMAAFSDANCFLAPTSGWINAIRTTLGISLVQLSKKCGVSHQALADYE